jgi:hypothetical protein
MLSSSFQNPFSFKTKFIILAKGFSSKIALDPQSCCVVPDGGVVCPVLEKPIYPPMFSKIPLEVFAVNVGDTELMIALDSGAIVTLQPGQMVTPSGQVMVVKTDKGLLDADGFSIFMGNESYHHREGIYGDDKPPVKFGPMNASSITRNVVFFELMRDLQATVPYLPRPFDALQVLQFVKSPELGPYGNTDIMNALIQLMQIHHVYGYDADRRLIKSDLTGAANCALGINDLKYLLKDVAHSVWVQLDFNRFEGELNKLNVDQCDFAIQAFVECQPAMFSNKELWVESFNKFTATHYLNGGTAWLEESLGECVRNRQPWAPNFQPQFAPQPMQMPLDQSRMYQTPPPNFQPQHPMPGTFPPPGMPFGQIQHPHYPMGHNANPRHTQF